ncbi:unnamed protein product [Clonostachys solani]|uniref:Single-strand DNA deaminase toxin A-like C-terminal domain-containing protein n=1 Tax=Clonostachys solani TaxID=160281 RepID=A0A9N9ZHQ5_9HYPO|nr:unnamed protein product [Clonostachys solani]
MAHPPIYKANVMWWNKSSIYIRCPHCDKIHRHGFDGEYRAEYRRAPHCENDGCYSICFPSNGLYEIDQSRCLYVRAGDDPADYFEQLKPELRVDVSHQRKWTEAKEEVEMDEYHRNKLELISRALGLGPLQEVERGNRLQIAVSDMSNGRLEAVRSYLETSHEKNIFLHGVQASVFAQSEVYEGSACQDIEDGQDGNCDPSEAEIEETITSGVTALHLAACERHPEMVKLLLDYGADPNARMVDGRTPLMEAAIWGRLGNTKHLLSYGADKSIQCVREGKQLRAIDLARDTLENSEERYNRSGRNHQIYKEVTHERNLERAAIFRELNREAMHEEYEHQTPFLGPHSFCFTSIFDGGNVISILANFDVPNKRKTVGILFRSTIVSKSAFPPVAAMSGWGHAENSNLDLRIAGKTWTNEVFQLCRLIGHNLPTGGHDLGIPEQFYACHAEKQLTAYFVNKHLFLSQEGSSDDFGMSTLSLEASDGRHIDRLMELREAEPPQRLQKAIILTSRAVCYDCQAFIIRVNRVFTLDIDLQGPAV